MRLVCLSNTKLDQLVETARIIGTIEGDSKHKQFVYTSVKILFSFVEKFFEMFDLCAVLRTNKNTQVCLLCIKLLF